MKYFQIFLAYCILHIATMPCKDVHETSTGLFVTVIDAVENHEDHNDSCSPFCICSCCQTSITIPSFLSSIQTYESNCSAKIKFYDDNYTSSEFAVIWHPPKIS